MLALDLGGPWQARGGLTASSPACHVGATRPGQSRVPETDLGMSNSSHPILAETARYGQLSQQLGVLLARRNLRLITQAEYETLLHEVASLLTATALVERDLRGGCTRFLLRNRRTGEVLASLDFQLCRTPPSPRRPEDLRSSYRGPPGGPAPGLPPCPAGSDRADTSIEAAALSPSMKDASSRP